MERGTPSLNAFLGSLEVQECEWTPAPVLGLKLPHHAQLEEMKLIDPTLMRQFLVQASHRPGARPGCLQSLASQTPASAFVPSRLAGEGGLPGTG